MIMDDSPLTHLAQICSNIGLPSEPPISTKLTNGNSQPANNNNSSSPSSRVSPKTNSTTSHLRTSNQTNGSSATSRHALKAKKQQTSNNSSVTSTPTPTPSESSLNNSNLINNNVNATNNVKSSQHHAGINHINSHNSSSTIGAIKNSPNYAHSRANPIYNHHHPPHQAPLPYNLNGQSSANAHLNNYLEQQKQLQQHQQNAVAASLLSLPTLGNPVVPPHLATNQHYNILAEAQQQQFTSLLMAYHQQQQQQQQHHQQQQQQSPQHHQTLSNQKRAQTSPQNPNDLLMAAYQQALLASCHYRPNIAQFLNQPNSHQPNTSAPPAPHHQQSASPASSPLAAAAVAASLGQSPLTVPLVSAPSAIPKNYLESAAAAAAAASSPHPPHCLCPPCIYMKSAIFR